MSEIRTELYPERVLSGEWNKAYGIDSKGRRRFYTNGDRRRDLRGDHGHALTHAAVFVRHKIGSFILLYALTLYMSFIYHRLEVYPWHV